MPLFQNVLNRRPTLAVLYAALLAACSGDPTAAAPQKVYMDGFETPIDEVRIEAEGGTVVRGYDAWLKILPSNRLMPRREDEYRYIDCAEPRAFFARVLGSDALAERHANLDCLQLTDERFEFDNGRWLIRNRSDGRVYFRVWKH